MRASWADSPEARPRRSTGCSRSRCFGRRGKRDRCKQKEKIHVGPTPGFTPAEVEQLKAGGKNNVEIFMPATADEMNKLLPECDVIFGQLNAATLAKAKNLKWVQNLEAGLERELFPELAAHPCAMTNMARMYAPALGETMLCDTGRGTTLPRQEGVETRAESGGDPGQDHGRRGHGRPGAGQKIATTAST